MAQDIVKNSTTIVLGSTGGIGLACLKHLALRGQAVVAVGRDIHRLRETTAQLRNDGHRAGEFELDLSGEYDGVRLVDYCHSTFGNIDAVINAAAIYEPSPATMLDSDSWERTMGTNLRGPLVVTSTLAADMIGHGGGRIVHITSITAHVSRGGYTYYEASKAGLVAATRSMAVELASRGVTVNSVAPGWVRTPMTKQILAECPPDRIAELIPLGRVGEPEEIAAVAVWLATDSPAFLTGQTIVVDGGQSSHTSHL